MAMAMLAIGAAAFLYRGSPSPGGRTRRRSPGGPGGNTSLPPPHPHPSATAFAAETTAGGNATPAAEAGGNATADVIAALMKRGEQSLSLGDVAAAGCCSTRAAEPGNAQAAVGMEGHTIWTPLPPTGRGERAEPALAAAWSRQGRGVGRPAGGRIARK